MPGLGQTLASRTVPERRVPNLRRLVRLRLALPIALLLLSACRPAPGAGSRSTPTAPLTPTPILTPTPAFQGRVLDLAVHTHRRPGDWLVVGLLENASDFAVEAIQLLVRLEDARGQTVAETTVLAVLPHLAPGETTPFEARFEGVGAVSGAEAQVLLSRRTSLARGQLLVSEPEAFLDEQGNTLLLGQVSNPGELPLALDGLAYVGLDGQAELSALALPLHASTWLEAGEALPFLAVAEGDQTALRWIGFSDASREAAPLQLPVLLDDPPTLLWTDQGRPFAVGELVNTSGQSRAGAVLLAVRYGEQVIGLSSFTSPFPLGPQERLAFGQADFPGLSLRLAGVDREQVELQAWVDPRASAPSPDHRLPLAVQIDTFETVGSAVFLRGSAANVQSISLSLPGVYAALRATEGELLTAGWRQLAPRLAAGERLDFVLDLPFPAGADLALAEIDVLGYGLGP